MRGDARRGPAAARARRAWRRAGDDVTVVTWGQIAARVPGGRRRGDRRRSRSSTCARWCRSTWRPCSTSVRRTGRLLIVHEAVQDFGAGRRDRRPGRPTSCSTSCARPVRRLGAPPVPMPFSPELERALLPGPNAIAERRRRPCTRRDSVCLTCERSRPPERRRPRRPADQGRPRLRAARRGCCASGSPYGELREGDRLPSETALAQQAGVSRSTVREALRTSQEAGLIERASPRMMVVAPQRRARLPRAAPRAAPAQRDLPPPARGAASRSSPSSRGWPPSAPTTRDIRALHENLDAQAAHLEDFAEWSRLDEEFHSTIAEMSANPALIIARAPITQLLLPALYRFMRSAR